MSKIQVVNTQLFRDAAAITLSQRKWGNTRKVPMEQAAAERAGILRQDMSKEERDKIKKMLKLSTKLIDSPEYEAIAEFQSAVRKEVLSRCVPSYFKKGLYLSKTDQVPVIDKIIEEANQKLRDELVPAFITAFPKRQEEARAVLEPKGLYRVDDYAESPGDLAQSFGIDHYWVAFGTPDNLPEEMRKREAAKLEKKFQEVELELIMAAREGFAKLVDHLVERLKVEPGEKPKTFKKGTIENIEEFIRTFSNRNLLNDVELEKLVDKAREAIRFVTPQGLRDSVQLRERTTAAFEELKSAVDQMIIKRPSRKFEFEEDAA